MELQTILKHIIKKLAEQGRDGIESYVKMVYSESDFNTSLYFIDQKKNENEKNHDKEMLRIMNLYISEMNLCEQYGEY